MARTGSLIAVIGMTVAVAAAPTAGAQEGARGSGRWDRPAGSARFEGAEIDLRAGWGAARACMVWREGGVVECFRSPDAMAARERAVGAGRDKPADGTRSASSSSWTCSSPLRLYEHGNYGGRQLSFWDPGFWQNLGDWGFNDAVSSFRVGSCRAWMAEHVWGDGEWYPGNTAPWARSASMWPGWNDRISSIYNG